MGERKQYSRGPRRTRFGKFKGAIRAMLAQGVAADVAVISSMRQLPDLPRVENDQTIVEIRPFARLRTVTGNSSTPSEAAALRSRRLTAVGFLIYVVVLNFFAISW